MKKVLVSICFMSVFKLVLAQGVFKSIPNEYSPVSPNAAAFQRYGNVPVSYYTGTPKIDIPLIMVQEKDLQLPVSISYHASGIKVGQEPTWMGLGWTLNAGGAIVRNVRGIPDEKVLKGYLNHSNLPSQYKTDDAVWSNAGNSPAINMDIWTDYHKYWYGNVDPSPDDFTYNFGGRTGKFMITRTGEIVTDSKIKIQYELVNPSGGHQDIVKWTIIDESGVKYIFSSFERTETFSQKINSSLPITSTVNETAWYLNEIISPDANSSIKLYYSEPVSLYQVSSSELFFLQNAQKTSSICPDGPYKSTGSYGFQTYIYGIFLTKIETSTIDVYFESENFTGNSLVRKRIKSIDIKKKDGSLIKKYVPSYSLVGNKFLLKSLTESGVSESLPPYEFEYHPTAIPVGQDIPGGFGYARMDHWGYYCGPNSNPKHTKIPAPIVFIDQFNHSVPGPDRSPDFNYMQAGILLKIIYPTGGSTSFEYEQNSYSFLSTPAQQRSSPTAAGGLRIKKIIDHDAFDVSKDVIRSFKYLDENGTSSSGVIKNDPVYKYNLNIPANANNTATSGEIWFDKPIESVDIGYRRVVEEFSSINGNGKILYEYTTPWDYADPYIFYDKTYLIHALPLSDQMLFQKFSHPFVNSIDRGFALYGLLKSKTTYDKDGVFIQKQENNYEFIHIGTVSGAASQGIDSYDYGACLSAPRSFWFYQQYILGIGRADLIQTLTTTNDATKLIQNTTRVDYEYSPNNFQVSRSFEQRSNGTSIETIYKYPSDFNSTAMNGKIATLLTGNILSPPIHELKLINSKIISGSITELNDYGKPVKLNYFESDNNDNTSYIFNPDQINPDISLFKEIESFTYNHFQRVISRTSRNGISSFFQWDSNSNNVICKLDNIASSSSYFFTSFEDNTGTEGVSLTGDKYYSGNSYVIPVAERPVGSNLQMTYWYFDGQWKYQSDIPYNPVISKSGALGYDEIRVFPTGIFMTTYSYDSSFRLKSINDQNNLPKFFKYDQFGRLSEVLDHNSITIKKYEYNYRD